MKLNWIYNIVIRLTVLALKLFGVIILAREMADTEFVTYGIVVSMLTFFIYLLGFDLYHYYSKEVVRGIEAGAQVRRCFQIYFIGYALFLVVFGFINYFFQIIPLEWHFLFCVLVIAEHVNQEIQRLLVLKEHQLLSTFMVLLRHGGWVLVMLTFYLGGGSVSLSIVMTAMATLSIIALLIGAKFVDLGEIVLSSKLFDAINLKWLVSAAKSTWPLLLAALCFRGVLSVDRVYLEFVNDENAAVYIFYMLMAGSLLAVYEAAVYSYIIPRLLRTKHRSEAPLIVNSALGKVIVLGLLALLFGGWSAEFIVRAIGKENYFSNVLLFYICVTAVIVYSLGQVYYYALYSWDMDKGILFSNLIGFVAFMIGLLFFYTDVYSVAYSLLMCFLCMLIVKAGYYYKCLYQD